MAKEGVLQRSCLDWLAFLEKKGLPVYATRTNSGKIRTHMGHFVQLCREGWPDITALINGRYCGFEVKKPKETQRPAQVAAQVQIEKSGGLYYVIKDISRFKDIVNNILEGSPK